MKIRELKEALANNPATNVRFVLPNGTRIAAHAHVTEAARIDKRFVDCGGTFREESFCRLQTWVSDDLDHRLQAKKLLRILQKAEPILHSEDLEVDLEHEVEYISQFPIEKIESVENELLVSLAGRHTACLAEDQCCPKPTNMFSLTPRDFALPNLSAR